MIKHIETIKKPCMSISKYEGHGQIVKVVFENGAEGAVSLDIEPYDPVFGVRVTYLEERGFWISPPKASIKDLDAVLKNIEEARAFCNEFLNIREDILKAPK